MGGLTLVHARQILAELFGLATETESSWMLTLFGFCSGATIIIAFRTSAAFPASGRKRIGFDGERTISPTLSSEPADSLGYFATRRDRSALFTGDCAVTYRVEKGVCLVAGDPIGPHTQWGEAARAFVAHAQSYGWVPAVPAASDKGRRPTTRPDSRSSSSVTKRCCTAATSRSTPCPRSTAPWPKPELGLRPAHPPAAEIPQAELSALA